QRRTHGEEAGYLAARLETPRHVVEIDIAQTIAVIGEEHVLLLDMGTRAPQALADIAPDAGVEQGHAPVAVHLLQQFDIAPAIGDDAIGESLRADRQEEILHDIGLVTETEDKVVVAVIAV